MNTEKTLYLALLNLYNALEETEITDDLASSYHGADVALRQFEIELGPLPDWATAHNIAVEPVLYAQLFTRNSRAFGNAMIFHIAGERFGVITDMGNTMTLNRKELDQCFEIGDYIMNEAAREFNGIPSNIVGAINHRTTRKKEKNGTFREITVTTAYGYKWRYSA